MKLTLSSRLKSGIRDESDFAVIQHETGSRNRTTAVYRPITRVDRCVTIAVCLAFACGLVVESRAQNILFSREVGSQGEQISRIGLDATGIYMVGQRRPTDPASGAFIRKTDFAGAELWTRQLGPSSSYVTAFGVAASPIGVYAIGVNQAPPNAQLGSAFLEKYDPDGNPLLDPAVRPIKSRQNARGCGNRQRHLYRGRGESVARYGFHLGRSVRAQVRCCWKYLVDPPGPTRILRLVTSSCR